MKFVVKLKQNSLIARVEKLLLEHEALSRAELAELMEVPSAALGSLLTRLTKESGPKSPQRIYIKDWIDEQQGARKYPRARYAIGTLPNAKKPKPKTNLERSRAYYAKVTTQRINSVFDLGNARGRFRRGVIT